MHVLVLCMHIPSYLSIFIGFLRCIFHLLAPGLLARVSPYSTRCSGGTGPTCHQGPTPSETLGKLGKPYGKLDLGTLKAHNTLPLSSSCFLQSDFHVHDHSCFMAGKHGNQGCRLSFHCHGHSMAGLWFQYRAGACCGDGRQLLPPL